MIVLALLILPVRLRDTIVPEFARATHWAHGRFPQQFVIASFNVQASLATFLLHWLLYLAALAIRCWHAALTQACDWTPPRGIAARAVGFRR